MLKQWWAALATIGLAGGGLTAGLMVAETTVEPLAQTVSQVQAFAANPNPTLQIGILQRFGSQDSDEVVIAAPTGSLLTLEFTDASGQVQTQRTPRVTLGIVNQGLATPETVERLILSSHKSFESAEAAARQWQARGILTEVAQPQEWQVWAARDAYTSEQKQQILSQSQAEGIPTVRLQRDPQTDRPVLSWVHDHFRYHRQHLSIRSDAGIMQVGEYTYAGGIRVQPNAYGSYSIVNDVPLETYLRGVVPHEIGPGAPMTAIEAQAILARTYALRNLHRFVIDDYELCANTHCQVYRGLSGTIPAIDAAIQRTAGQVITFEGDLADAVYSSTSGGVSAAFEDIWDGDPRPYLQPMADRAGQPRQRLDLSQPGAFAAFIQQQEGFNEVGISRFFRWQDTKTLNELSESLRAGQDFLGIPLPSWEKVTQLAILSRAPSGRIQDFQVTLATTDGGSHSLILEKDQVRLAFPSLLSTLFDLDPVLTAGQLTGYTFVGGGFGHGVGMSQYGSYGLSRQGYTAAQIMDFYYPGTILMHLGSLSRAE